MPWAGSGTVLLPVTCPTPSAVTGRDGVGVIWLGQPAPWESERAI